MSLKDLIQAEVNRALASRYNERHGLVTSYDSKKHRAKVMFQPEGADGKMLESDWMPIETGHAGPGFGMLVGPTPGDGKKTGDQVVIRPQEGDVESMKIVRILHSDVDNPPEVKSGECCIWTKWGQQIFFHENGSLTLKTGQTPQAARQPGQSDQQFQQMQQQQQQKVKQTSIEMDNQGNITTNVDNDHNVNAANNHNETAGNSLNSTSPTINKVGNVHLGDRGGKLISQLGTVDTGGFVDIPAPASKVFAV